MSLSVEEGARYAFLGPNGAGKTTTIHLLMNLTRPTSGRAEALGVDSRRLGPETLERIGYVSENQKMPDWMTVGEFLEFSGSLYPNWDAAYRDALLDRFELPLGQKLKHCSRGMRMKAALISSLAYRPKLLVLDEPFSGLDPGVRDDMTAGIAELAREHGAAVFVSSHDLAEVETLCDQVGFLKRGTLRVSEPLASLRARFRRLEVTRVGETDRHGGWPAGWCSVERTENGYSFNHESFDAELAAADVREQFGDGAEWSAHELTLREIFLALGRN